MKIDFYFQGLSISSTSTVMLDGQAASSQYYGVGTTSGIYGMYQGRFTIIIIFARFEEKPFFNFKKMWRQKGSLFSIQISRIFLIVFKILFLNRLRDCPSYHACDVKPPIWYGQYPLKEIVGASSNVLGKTVLFKTQIYFVRIKWTSMFSIAHCSS